MSQHRAHRTPGRHTHWRLARRRRVLLRGGTAAALLAVVGPGLLAGLSDDDPAGILPFIRALAAIPISVLALAVLALT